MDDLPVSLIGSVLNSVATPAVIMDNDRNVIEINKAATSLLRVFKKQSLGKSVLDLLSGSPSVIVLGTDRKLNLRIKIKDNKKIYRLSFKPLRIDQYILGTFKVVDKNNSSKEVRENQASILLSKVCHDIRTPLSVIRGVAFLMIQDGITNLERENLYGHIDSNVTFIRNLLDDILDFSCVDRGKMHISKRRVRTVSLFSNILVPLKELSKNRSIIFETRVKSLPVIIETDPVRLRQIISNLVENAVKYCEPGCHIEVDISGDRERNSMTVKVIDNGPGIP